MQITKLEKKILKIIARHSTYSISEIKRGYKNAKSIDILMEAVERAPGLNISLDMAIMSSPIPRRE